MMHKALIASLTLALLAACAYSEEAMTGPDPLPRLSQQQDAPRLAMLEHVLDRYFASDITNPPTVCVAIADGGSIEALPAADETALIARFTRLAPFSRCSFAEGRWTDATSGDPAMLFTLHSFACPSAAQCRGWAGYRYEASNSMSYEYAGEWSGGEWRFTRNARLMAE